MQSTNRIRFILTGFGEFFGVTNNPTQVLIDSLSAEAKNRLNIVRSEVLEVSIQGVDGFIDSINTMVQNESTQLNTSNSLLNKTVIIHLGVYSEAETFLLEETAYNQKDFCCPDMRGNEPSSEKILEDCSLDSPLASKLPIQSICDTLNDVCGQSVFAASSDPGRYICNYIYFQSLCRLQNAHENTVSVFLHCPPFEKIAQTVQAECLELLIAQVKQVLDK